MCEDYVGVYNRLLNSNNQESILSASEQVVSESDLASFPTRL
jgi:hypothetical protein